jgi:glycosyltransferase involved in cell wall biosynthesis
VASRTKPQHIVVVTQFYPPEACAAGNRVAAIAHALLADGNAVSVVTGKPSFPDGIIPEPYRGREAADESGSSVRVKRVATYASPKLRTIDRLLNWLSVALGITAELLTMRSPVDIVLVSMPPVTLFLPALAVSLFRRAVLIVDVRDVYPDIAVKMGIWKRGSLITRLVGWAVDVLYRRARLIFTVTDSCRAEILARGVPPAKVITARNGFDAAVSPESVSFARDDREFVVAYAGNFGIATGIDVVLDAARALRDRSNFRFRLIGGGAETSRMQQRIAAERLDNVTLLGAQPRGVAAALLEQSDVCVVPLKRGVVDSLPTKMFDALALGTPVVVCADGEARAFVEASGGGCAVPPEDGDGLAAALVRLEADRSLLARYGSRGSAYVWANYDRRAVSADVSRRISALALAR